MYFIDLESKDIQDPLAQFNHTFPVRDSIFSLVTTLNNALTEKRLDSRILEQIFDTYWPQFEEKLDHILKTTKMLTPPEARSEEDLLSEILANTRLLNSRIRHLEKAESERW